MDNWLNNKKVVILISALIAILLWAIVRYDQGVMPTPTNVVQQETKVYKSFPITYVGLDPEADLILTSVEYTETDVTIRGTKDEITRMDPGQNNFRIEVDLSGIEAEGEYSLPLNEVGFPKGLIVNADHFTTKVVVENLLSKEMDVQIQIIGSQAEGYEQDPLQLDPLKVTVKSSESVLGNIYTIYGEVDISGAVTTVEQEVPLIALDESGNAIETVQLSESSVNVKVPIQSPSKSMPLIISLIGETPEGYSVVSYKQSVDEITVFAPQEVLDSMDRYEMTLDISALTGNQIVNLNIPILEKVRDVYQNQVVVEVEIAATASKIIQNVPVNIIGAGEYDASIIDPSNGLISVTLNGAAELLQNIEEVEATVDVSGFSEGTYTEEVTYTLPNFISATYTEVTIDLSKAVDVNPNDAEDGSQVGSEETEQDDTTDDENEPAEQPVEVPSEEEEQIEVSDTDTDPIIEQPL
ncbi:CdaR family protein [Longirhabdus pacifica]|uniref:CdaR family protein n=1 Tax=Longirhabdus pacifica TaxID=2305227 RepID=UPI0010086BFF|nr:CdaR family protein [Longirhabdus pacifica]